MGPSHSHLEPVPSPLLVSPLPFFLLLGSLTSFSNQGREYHSKLLAPRATHPEEKAEGSKDQGVGWEE